MQPRAPQETMGDTKIPLFHRPVFNNWNKGRVRKVPILRSVISACRMIARFREGKHLGRPRECFAMFHDIRENFDVELRKKTTDSLVMSRRKIWLNGTTWEHRSYQECLTTFKEIFQVYAKLLGECEKDQSDTLRIIGSSEQWEAAISTQSFKKVLEIYAYEKAVDLGTLTEDCLKDTLLLDICTMKKFISEQLVSDKASVVRCSLSSSLTEVHCQALSESNLIPFLRYVLRYHKLCPNNLLLLDVLWSICNYCLATEKLSAELINSIGGNYFRDLGNLVMDEEIMTRNTGVDILETVYWGLSNLIGKSRSYTGVILNEWLKLSSTSEALPLFACLELAYHKICLSELAPQNQSKINLAKAWFLSNLIRNVADSESYKLLALESCQELWEIYQKHGHLCQEFRMEAFWGVAYLLESKLDKSNRFRWILNSGALKEILANMESHTKKSLLLRSILKILYAIAVDLQAFQIECELSEEPKKLPELSRKFNRLTVFTPDLCRSLKFLAITNHQDFIGLRAEALEIWVALVSRARPDVLMMHYEEQTPHAVLEVICNNLVLLDDGQDLRYKAVQLAYKHFLILGYLQSQYEPAQLYFEDDEYEQYILMDLDVISRAGFPTGNTPAEDDLARLNLVPMMLHLLQDISKNPNYMCANSTAKRAMLVLDYLAGTALAKEETMDSHALLSRFLSFQNMSSLIDDFTLVEDNETSESARRLLHTLVMIRGDTSRNGSFDEEYRDE